MESPAPSATPSPTEAPSANAAPGRLGRSVLFGLVGQVFALAVGLWSTPALLGGLGEEAYGVLALLSSFVAYFAYLELGLGAAYLRELGLSLSRGEAERAQRLVETAHALYVRVGFVGAGLMLASGSGYFAWALHGRPTLWPALAGLWLSAGGFFSSMALSASRGAIFAAQRPDLFTRASMVLQPLIPLAQVLGVWLGGGLAWTLFVPVVTGVSIDLLMRWHARILLPNIVFRRRFHADLWGELKGFSLYKFAHQLAQQGQTTADRLLLGFLLPVAAVAPYAVAASIALRVRSVVGAVTGPFFSIAVGRFANEGAEGLSALLVQFGRRAALLFAVAVAGASFLAAPFLAAWVGEHGPAYVSEGSAVLSISICSVAFLLLSVLLGQATDATGHPRDAAAATVGGLVVSLIAGAGLGLWRGAAGVALGFLCGSLFQCAVSLWFVSRRAGSRAARLFLRDVLLRPAVVALASYGVMRAAPHGDSFWSFLPASALGALAGLGVAFVLGALRRDDLRRAV